MTTPSPTKDYWIDTISAAAPNYVSAFLDSSAITIELMDHEAPNVRAAAIMAGHAIWKLDRNEEYVAKCCRIANADTNEHPRYAAVAILALAFANSKDRVVKQALAKIVLDEKVSNHLRNCAYRAIAEIEYGTDIDALYMNGDYVQEINALMTGRVVDLAEIDWEFISNMSSDKS